MKPSTAQSIRTLWTTVPAHQPRRPLGIVRLATFLILASALAILPIAFPVISSLAVRP